MNTTLKNAELSANGTDKSNSIFEMKKINNTPFMAITEDEVNWYVIIKNYRLYTTSSYENCVIWVEEITWDKIFTIFTILLNEVETIKNLTNEN